MRADVHLNLFLSLLITTVLLEYYDSVDCLDNNNNNHTFIITQGINKKNYHNTNNTHRRTPRRYHALRHTGGAAIFMTESLRLNREQVCDGHRLRIKCPEHTKIMVETAFYGRLVPSSELCPPNKRPGKQQQQLGSSSSGFSWHDQRFEDTSCDVSHAYTKITEKCQNKDSCEFKVNANFFKRDPCKETSKYLQLSYKCRPSQFMSDSVCENSNVDLSCKTKNVFPVIHRQRLAIYSATYGRTVGNAVANCDKGNMTKGDCVADVLHRVMQICHAKHSCSFNVTDESMQITSSPCPPDIQKNLNLIYMCVDESIFSPKYLVGSSNSDESSSQDKWTPSVGVTLTDNPMTTTGQSMTPTTGKRFPLTSSGYTPTMNDGRSSSAAAVPPPSSVDHSQAVSSRINNGSFGGDLNDPSLVDLKCSWSGSSVMTTTVTPLIAPSQNISPCIPPSTINAIGFLHNWIATLLYLKHKKEKLILYFCLSASAGVIFLLVILIVQLFWKRSANAKRMHRKAFANGTASKEVDYMSVNSPLVFDNESRMEMTDFGRDGVSFMRFNHPTPPRSGHVSGGLPHFYNNGGGPGASQAVS